MTARVPLYYRCLSDKGRAHSWIRNTRITQASPRMQQLSEPTFKLDNLAPEVIEWLAERKSRPTRIFAHEIEFQTPEEAVEFKFRWA